LPLPPGSSYFGALEFLDSQIAFDITFSARPVPLLVTASSTGVSVCSLLPMIALDKFIDECKFLLFVPIFCFNHVDPVARDEATSLHAAITALKKLSMSSRHPSSAAWTLTCN
jgi:hypothetical protein